MAASRYERFIEASAERERRKANIEKLRKMIAADEDVLAVIPASHGNLETSRERQLMHKHITRMREWLNEEIAMHNKTLEEGLDGINI